MDGKPPNPSHYKPTKCPVWHPFLCSVWHVLVELTNITCKLISMNFSITVFIFNLPLYKEQLMKNVKICSKNVVNQHSARKSEELSAVSKCFGFPPAKFYEHHHHQLFLFGNWVRDAYLPTVLFVFFGPKTFMQLQHALAQRLLLKGRANHCAHQIFILALHFRAVYSMSYIKAAFTPSAQC